MKTLAGAELRATGLPDGRGSERGARHTRGGALAGEPPVARAGDSGTRGFVTGQNTRASVSGR